MKNLSFFCLLSLFIFFSACSDKQVVEPQFDGLQLRVVNQTDHDLDNTNANGIDFGTVQTNETTDYKVLESMLEMPAISANIRGVDYYGGSFCIIFCGTGIVTITEGTYTLYVDGIWDENMLQVHLEKEETE